MSCRLRVFNNQNPTTGKNCKRKEAVLRLCMAIMEPPNHYFHVSLPLQAILQVFPPSCKYKDSLLMRKMCRLYDQDKIVNYVHLFKL